MALETLQSIGSSVAREIGNDIKYVANGCLNVTKKGAHGVLYVAAESTDLAAKGAFAISTFTGTALTLDAAAYLNGIASSPFKDSPHKTTLFFKLFSSAVGLTPPANIKTEDLDDIAKMQLVLGGALIFSSPIVSVGLSKLSRLITRLNQSF